MTDPEGTPKMQAAVNLSQMLQDVANKAADADNHDIVISAVRALQQKPGVQTTEFWLSIVLTAAGGAMQFWPGHEAVGGILMSVAGAAYALSRGIVKAAQAK